MAVFSAKKTPHTCARTLQYQRPSSAAQSKPPNNFSPVPDQDQRINISQTGWTDTIGGFWVLEAALILVIHQSRIWTLNRKDQISRYSHPVKTTRNVSYRSMKGSIACPIPQYAFRPWNLLGIAGFHAPLPDRFAFGNMLCTVSVQFTERSAKRSTSNRYKQWCQ
jgi:hypothetical protein